MIADIWKNQKKTQKHPRSCRENSHFQNTADKDNFQFELGLFEKALPFALLWFRKNLKNPTTSMFFFEFLSSASDFEAETQDFLVNSGGWPQGIRWV